MTLQHFLFKKIPKSLLSVYPSLSPLPLILSMCNSNKIHVKNLHRQQDKEICKREFRTLGHSLHSPTYIQYLEQISCCEHLKLNFSVTQ